MIYRSWVRSLCVSAFTVACASAQPAKQVETKAARPAVPPPASVSYAAGSAALEQNDPVGAARIFAAVPASDPDHALAQKALSATLPDVAAVAQSWLKIIDRNMKQERFVAAKKRLEYLLDYFMLDDATRSAIEDKLEAVDQDVAVAHANLEELDKQVSQLTQGGDLNGALRVMRRALGVARDAASDTVFDRERRISAVEQRLGPAMTRNDALPPTTVASKEPTRPPRSKRGKKNPEPPPQQPPTQPATPPPSDDGEATPEPQDATSRAREVLEQAQAFEENRAYFNAIVGYLRVRELDPGNDQAHAALQRLEPQRQALVQDYLESANRHFQQQDLESAVPYFRRVLSLDPNNEQAKKGLEMHYNLERIRRETNRR